MKAIKKLLLAITMMILGISNASAVSYRGFFDVAGTYDFIKYHGPAVHMSTTHGIQWRNIFGGIGFGFNYIQLNNYDINTDNIGGNNIIGDIDKCNFYGIPVYANIRYDFFSLKKTNFFVSLKLGYNIALIADNCMGSFIADGYRGYIGDGKKSGLFYQPTIGLRTKISSHAGVNFGLTLFNQYANFKFEYYSNYEQFYKFYSEILNSIGVLVSIDF